MASDVINDADDDDLGVWSDWSAWAACSRPCDGGIATRRRHCFNPRHHQRRDRANAKTGSGSDAEGEEKCAGGVYRKDRICNMQSCPPSPLNVDYRSQQCAEFNDVPYEVSKLCRDEKNSFS